MSLRLGRSGSSVRAQCLHAVAVLMLAMPAVRVQAAPVAGREVVLSPGTCPAVQDGDIAVLDWNPAFESTLSLAELENFHLRFILPLERRTTRSGSVLELRLRPQRSVAPVEAPLEDIHNGYFRMRFRVNTQALASGEYHLANAEAVTKMAADGTSIHAAMTNDPSHAAFCVTVSGAANEGTRGKKDRSN